MENHFTVKNGIFDTPRKVVIAPEFIELSDAGGIPVSRISSSEFEDFRHDNKEDSIAFGSPFQKFNAAKKFIIEIKGNNGTVIKIDFKHVSSSAVHTNGYQAMVDLIHQYFLSNIVNNSFDKFRRGEDVLVGRLNIHRNGVNVVGTGLAFQWHDLRVHTAPRHFELSRIRDPRFHMHIDYFEWNSEHILALLNKILESIGQNQFELRSN
jgi:hypothetical protein